MKFREIFAFEFYYQIRRVWTWLFVIVLIALSFLFTRDGSFSEALFSEFFLNSPFGVAKTTVFGGLLWMLMAASVAGEAAARDVATGMHPLVYTSPVSKINYLGGRFMAALAVNAILVLFVQVGILLGVYLPGVDPSIVGPFRPSAFVNAYAIISIPNILFVTAIQFALALRSGRPMAAYMASLLLFFTAFFIASALLFHYSIGKVLDPIGVRYIWEDLSHQWTTVEKNWRLLTPDGTILKNRLLWMVIGLITIAATYFSFEFRHRVTKTLRISGLITFFRKQSTQTNQTIPVENGGEIIYSKLHPRIKPNFDYGTNFRQTLEITWESFKSLASSWAGLFLLIIVPLLTIAIVIDQSFASGSPLIPKTSLVIKELTGPLSAELSRWIIIPGFIMLFAGELVWRERDHGVSEILDSMPGSEWAPLVGKFLGIATMLLLFTTLLTTAGILAQVIMEYDKFEIGLYLTTMFGLQLPEYLLFAMLALMIHVLVNQKYVGHLAGIIVYSFIAVVATMLGIRHNLLIYGASPMWAYSEMTGFGSTIAPWLLFKLYWTSWAFLLAIVSGLLWIRGNENGWSARIAILRQRFNNKTKLLIMVAACLITGFGAYIFYNTNVLNTYLSTSEVSERRAAYEVKYGKYANKLQPELTRVDLYIELYPDQASVDIHGKYFLVNIADAPIDSIHVGTSAGISKTRSISFSRKAQNTLDDQSLSHQIYVLEQPLHPGDTLQMSFELRAEQRGFTNNGFDQSLYANGMYFSDGWFPSIGYQKGRELIFATDRRKYGLEARPIIASLYEADERRPTSRGGGISFNAVLETSDNHVAIAPGKLQRTWTEDGRRYFHYTTNTPISNEWPFFSGNYRIYQEVWTPSDDVRSISSQNPVTITMFHHPEHTAHIEKLLDCIKSSFNYYVKAFGSYPYDHLTIAEHPGAPGTGMHALSGMITHGQSASLWKKGNADENFDFPYAVIAHEMAHQWTLPYAVAEGAPFLSEGLAWYAAMKMIKYSRGDDQLQRLLSFMREPHPHPTIRRGEPLLRALDPYLSYRKGPFAMHALSEYAGADRVNAVLRRLIEQHDKPGAPLATTLDLYRGLQKTLPDTLTYLLHDLFEVNTFWQLKTESAVAVGVDSGFYDVTLDIVAHKLVYDSAGVESEIPMDEWLPIGIFGPPESGMTELSSPLCVEQRRIRSGKQSITIRVKGGPILAGIDPYHILDWEETGNDDNIERVRVQKPGITDR